VAFGATTAADEDQPTRLLKRMSRAYTPEAARWLVDTGAKAIGVDCFHRWPRNRASCPVSTWSTRIRGAGAILMLSLTNLAALPADRRFPSLPLSRE
jgi:kynurenine formamidase